MSGWSDFWDSLTGQGAAKKQQEALRQTANAESASNAEMLKYLREALGVETDFQNKALSAQEAQNVRANQMEQAALAEQARGTDLATSMAKFGMGADLMGQQIGLDQAIQMMQMNQAEGRTNNMARQSAMQQALPNLMALMGLNPQSIGMGYTEANPQALQRNLLSELGMYTQGVNNLTAGGQAQAGQPASGQVAGGLAQQPSIGGQAVGQAQAGASNTQPWTAANVDVNKLLMMSPTAQFQMKQAEDAVKRSLAARGGLNSSEYTAQMGNIGGQMAVQQADKAKQDMWNLINFGAGGQGGGGGSSTGASQAPQINLGNFGNDLSSTLNNAANNRANMYSNFAGRDSGMANLLSGMGQQRASSMGQIANAQRQGTATVNKLFGDAQATAAPSYLDTFGKLFNMGTSAYGAYNAGRAAKPASTTNKFSLFG